MSTTDITEVLDDSTEVLQPLHLSEATAIMPPLDATEIIPPVPQQPPSPPDEHVEDIDDDADDADDADVDDDPDDASHEVLLYPCGTVSIGQFEPCAHSQVQVLCCTCAGCTADVWSCGREEPRTVGFRYEAEYLASKFSQPTVLAMFAVAVLVLLTSHALEYFVVLFSVMLVFGVLGLMLAVSRLFGADAGI